MDGTFLFQANLDAETASQATTIDSIDLAFPISNYSFLEKTLDICYDNINPATLVIGAVSSFLYIRATDPFTLLLTKGGVIQITVVDRLFISASAFDLAVVRNFNGSEPVSIKAIYV